MSNKIVPHVYRSIIDNVIENVREDFKEYGMDDEVVMLLQAKWEAKLLETRVADFARAPAADSPDGSNRASTINYNQNILQQISPSAGPSNQQSAYGLSFPNGNHGLSLPGQSIHGLQSKLDDDLLRLRGGAPETEDIKPVIKPEPNAAGLLPGDEVIDSDLDDSDDELKDGADDEGEGEQDIVFCVYDKVQRVKNKWKTVFKDGVIHINGRDYLFSKCTGEFEW